MNGVGRGVADGVGRDVADGVGHGVADGSGRVVVVEIPQASVVPIFLSRTVAVEDRLVAVSDTAGTAVGIPEKWWGAEGGAVDADHANDPDMRTVDMRHGGQETGFQR